MKVYIGQCRGQKMIDLCDGAGFGEATQPNEFPPRRVPWFLDNGAFRDWRAGRPFNAHGFLRAVEDSVSWSSRPDFVVIPDRVGDARETYRLARRWIPRLSGTAPLYVVAQDGVSRDGMEAFRYIVPREPSGVFIGGTMEWKKKNSEWICGWSRKRGLPVHIGRIGSAGMVRWATYIGASSVDSTQPLWQYSDMHRFIAGVHHPRLWA